MKLWFFLLILVSAVGILLAIPVDISQAEQIAEHQLERMNARESVVDSPQIITNGTTVLGYVFSLLPMGYVVVSADTDLPPIIAYSTTSSYRLAEDPQQTLSSLLTTDLTYRYRSLANLPANLLDQRHHAWESLLQGASRDRFEQWPPEGSTPTEGWILTNWTQSAPYNNFCPVDLDTGNRAVAGCPSIAMGQVAVYWGTLNGTHFSDDDDYHHNYNGQSYWIDDDAETYDFPSFPELNTYLDNATRDMIQQSTLTADDKAAIAFACGIAANQVYAAAGSGTFGVDQAMQAYERCGFQGMELLTAEDDDVYDRMAQNMRDALPVHLAVVDPNWSSGHNVVVDGYNSDGYFHLNFGWGGSYNGWYLLPDEFPFDLTVLEGAIVDIHPYEYVTVWPDTLDFLTYAQVETPQTVTLTNLHTDSLTVESIDFDEMFGGALWQINTIPAELPCVLQPGWSITVSVQPSLPVRALRDTLSAPLRILLRETATAVTVNFNTDLISATDDQSSPIPKTVNMRNYPNPFNPETRINFSLPCPDVVTLRIYNLRGELVRELLNSELPVGEHFVSWNGTNSNGHPVASGVYLCKLSGRSTHSSQKILLLE